MLDDDDDGVVDYPDEGTDTSEGYEAPVDPIDGAVGGRGFVMRYRPDGCEEVMPGGGTREPEEFERFYFEPQEPGYKGLAPVLMDILSATSPAERDVERERRHCEFKARWATENGWRYVVLVEDECGSVGEVRQAILDQVGEVERPEPEPEPQPEPAGTGDDGEPETRVEVDPVEMNVEIHAPAADPRVTPEDLREIAAAQGAVDSVTGEPVKSAAEETVDAPKVVKPRARQKAGAKK